MHCTLSTYSTCVISLNTLLLNLHELVVRSAYALYALYGLYLCDLTEYAVVVVELEGRNQLEEWDLQLENERM